ncbi:hypothetical protein [Clostridium saccharoperbutylacetonicum]|uniref:hypothetical protein n=1 Tax=Clostridium saccharoperbutylacetonicum TaxID=36745 RepID=UPI0039EB9D91
MRKKNKIVISVIALGMILSGGSASASAEEIQIASFRNIVTGTSNSNVNITATTMKVEHKFGWQKNTDGSWNYYNSEGLKQIGWFNDNGIWYYFDKDGIMLHDISIDGYTLGSTGAWIK